MRELDPIRLRIDSEHYQERFRINQEKLTEFGSVPLVDMVSQPVLTGHTPSTKVDSYYEGEISFIKTDNLRAFEITGQFADHLSESGNEVIRRSTLKEGDLVVTIIGATHDIVGRAALIAKGDLPANINQNIALIRLKKSFSPEFLSIYLNSEVGKLALWYLARQTEQVNLNCREVEQVLVPRVSNDFVRYIEAAYKSATVLRDAARTEFAKAQNTLLDELGLSDWCPVRQSESERNFSDVWSAGRMDAEYYQPKYDEIVDAIKGYAGGWDTLGSLVTMRKCVEVGSKEYLDDGIPFVRVSNITPFEITEEKYISEGLYSEISHHQPQQGEILLSKDATPGIAHYLDEQPGKMIPSGGILRLKRRSDKVNDEYLTLTLNSMLTQEQVNRNVGGSVIMHWRPDQVAQTLIPILPKDKQAEIQRMVVEATELRKESKHLLECAKQAVEIAIEQDEATAVVWLEDAVAAAYGWPADLSDEQVLERLLALNLERYEEEGEAG